MISTRTLLITGAVLLPLALILSRCSQQPFTGEETQKLLQPGLQARLKLTRDIDIASHDQHSHLHQTGQGWVLSSKDNFPVQMDALRSNIRDLIALRKYEAKTSKAARYSALGVEWPADKASASRRLQLLDKHGKPLVDIILGKNKPGSEAAVYARPDAKKQAWLLRGRADWPADPMQWLNSQLLKLSFADLAEVRIQHADGELLLLRKAPSEKNLVPVELPKGRTLRSDSVANGIGQSLQNLRFEDVSKKLPAASKQRDLIRLRSHSGVEISLQLDTLDNGETWLDMQARHWHAKQSTDGSKTEAPVVDGAAMLKQLTAHSGWHYKMADFLVNDIRKRLADLLKPVAEPAPAATEQTTPAKEAAQPVATPLKIEIPAPTMPEALPTEGLSQNKAAPSTAQTETVPKAAQAEASSQQHTRPPVPAQKTAPPERTATNK